MRECGFDEEMFMHRNMWREIITVVDPIRVGLKAKIKKVQNIVNLIYLIETSKYK